MAEVTLRHICKVYPQGRQKGGAAARRGHKRTDGGVAAVEDISLTIRDKEFVVLVGPSGCGKSTTLRMIAGLESISSGELYIGDRLMNDVAPKDRDIAMVFQSYALYPHMTVYENMAFSLKLRKLPKTEIDRKVRQAAEILGITELLSRKPRALSGGQRQRVAIGRAIVREPQVFLMDEPLSNLDAKLRNQMRSELIKLRRRIDTTFIYVTHDQTEAMTLGDRIIIMKDGVIQQTGTPYEVFSKPANLFVAGFIGTPQMNVLPAELSLARGGYTVSVEGITFPLSLELQQHLEQAKQQPGEVRLGIRPEHIRLTPMNIPGSLKGRVEVAELLGSEVYLHVMVEQQPVALRVQTTDLDRDYTFEPGQEQYLYFTFPKEHIHLFDPKTERNLLV